MDEFRSFTLEEANLMLPEVIRLTEDALDRIKQIEQPWQRLGFKKYNAIHQITEEELIKVEWARQIHSLGIMPKGWLIVDFQSEEDPDTLWCWQYGEPEVCHTHKVWERFLHRRPIRRGRREEWREERER